MKWIINVLTVTLAVVLVIFLYGYSSNKEPINDDSGATPLNISSVINANNQFALDLYSELKDKEENIFFSPYSISVALAMTYEGARGQTAEEMRSVFHFPEDNNARRSSFAALHNDINNKNAKYQLSTANALWVQKNYNLLNNYTDTIQNYYGGKATNVDFEGATEDARKTINNWVEDKTNNKIKDLFPQGSLDRNTRLVLTDAIYFKGDWVKQFDEKETKQEEFRVNKDNVIQIPMMRRTDKGAIFNYTETEELQILEMIYEGEELSMLVLLPKNDELKSLEVWLTVENLTGWKNEIKEQRVNIFIPKFTLDTKYPLNGNLIKMGMQLAFSPDADFSGIDGTKSLFIDKVIHQAYVNVNEEGTEAAAATGVSMYTTSAGPIIPEFRANHPFIVIIQERETGNILFLGRIINPGG